jgi:hypothetical protein
MQNTQNLNRSVWIVENDSVHENDSKSEERWRIAFEYEWKERNGERLRIDIDMKTSQVTIGGSVVENLEGWTFKLHESMENLFIERDFYATFGCPLLFDLKEENLILIQR